MPRLTSARYKYYAAPTLLVPEHKVLTTPFDRLERPKATLFKIMPSTSSLIVALLVGLATVLGNFFIKLYRARMLLRDRQRQGLVCTFQTHGATDSLAHHSQPVAPGHSFLFGHLLYLKSVLDRLPKNAHYEYAFATIAREEFFENGAFYMDLWPMSGLFFNVVSPQIATQILRGIHLLQMTAQGCFAGS